MYMIKNVVFIHGYMSGPKANWYPMVTKVLEERDVKTFVPQLPGDMYPEHEDWLPVVKEQFADIDPEETLLVGHSLGTRAQLLFLDEYKMKVGAVLMVGAFSNNPKNAEFRGGNYANFFEEKLDIQKLKKLSESWTVLHSKDDDRIPFAQGKSIAKDLGAELVEVSGFLHFKAPQTGVKVLEIIQTIVELS